MEGCSVGRLPAHEPPKLTLRLRPSATAAREARRAIARLYAGLPDQLAGDLLLIASELVTNSVIHSGAPTGDPIELHVDVAYQRERLMVRVSVLDHGHGFEPPRPLDPGRAGQWGLHLVDRLSTGWGVEETEAGTEVWAVLPLPPTAARHWRIA
jgi:anti-sigma regulatory factor (Ser/Thr protein kinase)